MAGPFRDERETLARRNEDLERQNAELRLDLQRARHEPTLRPRRRPALTLAIVGAGVLVGGAIAAFATRRPTPKPFVAMSPEGKTFSAAATWRREGVAVKRPLRAVWAAPSGGGAVAVGDEGTIAMRAQDDSATWSIVTSNTSTNLRSVDGDNDLIAVGDRGTVLVFDRNRQSWVIEPSGTTEDLTSVVRTSWTDTYVVGKHGTILQRRVTDDPTALRWVRLDANTSEDLRSVTQSVNEVIAVGSGGTIVRIIGSQVVSQPSLSKASFSAVSSASNDRSIVGGAGGALVLAERDHPWAPLGSPLHGDVRAIARMEVKAVAYPAASPASATAHGLVIATTEGAWLELEPHPPFAREPIWEKTSAPAGITALASRRDSVLATTEDGQIWQLAR